MSVNEKMTAIADAIREHTGGTEKLDLDAMAAGVGEVYDAGSKTISDLLWEALQNGGSRKDYDQFFQSTHWTDEIYDPKYNINCNSADSARQTFYGARITSTKVPVRVTNGRLVYTFAYCTMLKTIPLLALEGITQINMPFTECRSLEDITIEGEIPLSVDFQYSTKLTRASIESIVKSLSDTAESRTLTLSQAAVEGAFGSAESDEWAALLATKPNWTISLV